MGILGDSDITLLQGDIEALRLEMEHRITDLTAQVQQKVDCQPFFGLQAELNKVFNRIDTMVELVNTQHYRINELEKEVVKLQQQNESILSIISIYNKSIKTE